jgi:phosphoglycolate phosphatase
VAELREGICEGEERVGRSVHGNLLPAVPQILREAAARRLRRAGTLSSGTGIDTIVFDLDGTLVDSSADIAAALNRTLAGLGRAPLSLDQVRGLIGTGSHALLRGALGSDVLAGDAYPDYIAFYAAHVCEGSMPYPGAAETLDALAAAGFKLALCTNKPERLTHALLDALGWEGRFAAIVGGDSLSQRKPDPAPLREAVARAGGGRALLVGDSITDAATARAAGVPFVAVSYGFPGRPVEELGAAAVIDSLVELPEVIARLRP